MKPFKSAHLLLVALIMISYTGFGQSFNCELISWDLIKDTVNLTGNPAAYIELSTEENDQASGYTSFLILTESGDTIVDYSDNPSFWIPTIPQIGEPVVGYILDLTPSFSSIGDNFNGSLSTGVFPECEFNLNIVSTTSHLERIDEIMAYPNPFSEQLQIRSSANQLLEIYNAIGILLYTKQNIEFEEITINTNDWPSGCYFLKRGNTVKKLIRY